MTLRTHILLFAFLWLTPFVLFAEQLFTSEFAPYETREDSQGRTHKQNMFYRDFLPKPVISTDSTLIARQILLPPANWSDRVITLHIEGVGSAYDLVINDQRVFSQEDAVTPVNINITKHLIQGVNRIDVILRKSRLAQIDEGLEMPKRVPFKGSYIVAQPYLHIHDLDISIHPDSTKQRGVLNIAVVLRNDFSHTESVDVGFDIYDPSGKLLDYSVNPFEVKGNSTDTVRFSPVVIGAHENKWSPDFPKLYQVTVYMRRMGTITEYIPRSVGYLDISYISNTVYNFGEPLTFKSQEYNAALTRAQTRKELLTLKGEGINTIAPSYPQPMWLYELCDELGVWVIDRLNINAVATPKDKKIGGTPANDPTLMGEYLKRAQGTYARTRSMGCVIAYSIGGERSGNGYNMYRLYEWMKEVDDHRPVIYIGAEDEWNSDYIEQLQ